MGCGAGAKAPPKDATDEQKKTLCSESGKQMLLLCVPPALEKADKVVITMPEEFGFLKEGSANLRKQAEKAREKPDAAGEAAPAAPAEGEEKPEEKPEEKKSGGGFLGKMANAAAGAIDKASDLMGKGMGAALDAAADGIDKAVGEVEKPMTTIGQDIVQEKKEEIAKVFQYIIGQLSLDDVAVSLVRGAAPHGDTEYKAVPSSALSDHLIATASEKLANQLRPVVKPAMDKHAGIKAWTSAIKAHTFAADKLEELKMPSFKKIELDIGENIVQQVIAQLASLIGKEEAAIRADPSGKTKCPATFAAVFSGRPLTELTFKNKET